MIKIKEWILAHTKFIHYAIIGVFTTAVSYGSFYLFAYVFKLEVNLANALSIICAVLFAYGGNKLFVFRTHCENFYVLWREFFVFVLSRALTMLLELFGVFFLATLMGMSSMLSKVIVSVVVIIINYFLANSFVFKSNK